MPLIAAKKVKVAELEGEATDLSHQLRSLEKDRLRLVEQSDIALSQVSILADPSLAQGEARQERAVSPRAIPPAARAQHLRRAPVSAQVQGWLQGQDPRARPARRLAQGPRADEPRRGRHPEGAYALVRLREARGLRPHDG